MSESFYVTLASNVKSFDENTLSTFKTKLASKISLNGEWQVGISSIYFTKSWYNITQDIVLNLVKEFPIETNFQNIQQNVHDEIVILKKGFYNNIDLVINTINLNLEKKFGEYSVVLNYDNLSKKCSFEWIFEGISLNFPNELASVLGFNADVPIIKDENNKFIMKARNIVDLSSGVHFMYVYSDLIEPSYVGDTIVPLLQIIPINNKAFGENIELQYENIHYHDLMCNEFETIEINIRDDTGQPIEFNFGRVVTVLHFKKWKNTI